MHPTCQQNAAGLVPLNPTNHQNAAGSASLHPTCQQNAAGLAPFKPTGNQNADGLVPCNPRCQQNAAGLATWNPRCQQTAAGSASWNQLQPLDNNYHSYRPGDLPNNNTYPHTRGHLLSSYAAPGGLSSTYPNFAVNTFQNGGNG